MFNFTMFGVIALVALVTDINGQLGGGGGGPGGFGAAAMGPSAFGMFAPPAAAAGWMMGQEASKNGVNFAVNSAIAKVDATDLPPELQV